MAGLGIEELISPRISTRSKSSFNESDDEEAANLWAAMEKLPTFKQLRTSTIESPIVVKGNNTGERRRKACVKTPVDVRKLTEYQRKTFVNRIFRVSADGSERFLLKLRNRIEKVGIQLPTVEVRFKQLTVEAEGFTASRALPTLSNTAQNIIESGLKKLGIMHASRPKFTILQDVSGIIRPARMTLLLGPPASGKTTLLLALAGMLDSSLKASGEITYNGHRLDEFVAQKTAAYVGQSDFHMGAMTVSETLDFSARCQGVGARFELLNELVTREKAAGILADAETDLFLKATSVETMKGCLQTDYAIKILGLDMCANTLIGDEMKRGISGGEKRRVTTGEMLVGATNPLFMDEISNGLDNSTAHQIVKCLQQIVHHREATALISLIQPTPETFGLFDDIILLIEGRIVYQGSCEFILPFFESCGFLCPKRKSVADFLLEVTSRKDQAQYLANRSRPYRYVPADEFAELFSKFHTGLHLNTEREVPFEKSLSHTHSLVFKKRTVQISKLLAASFAKEWLLLKRNAFIYFFKSMQIFVTAIISSTVFLKAQTQTYTISDGTFYTGALLFVLIFNLFNNLAEISFTIARLPTFYRHRDLLFYPSWIFTLPIIVLRIPISVIESIIWTITTYFIMGFAQEIGRFFKQLLVVFLIQQMAVGLFRSVAGLCRTMTLSVTGGLLSVTILLVLGGFFIPKDLIPSWWVWGYWASPLTYGYIALAINEFLSPKWMNIHVLGGQSLGLAVLENVDFTPENWWYWVGVAALFGFTILFNILFTLALAYLKPFGNQQAVVSKGMDLEVEEIEEIIVKEGSPPRASTSGQQMKEKNSGHSSNEIGMSDHQSPNVVTKKSAPRRGMVLPFTPLTMAFDEVNYYVSMPREAKNQQVTEDRLHLLNGITGAFLPGVLTALMGVSGAGKTTLMDVLAGRKTIGHITGDIRISGYPKNQATFTRVSGYCEQNDVHSSQLTVKESLLFSAFLRLPYEFNAEEKMQFVDEVLDLVELKNLKDALVGVPGISGLPIGQRKRLTVAVELVANPSIIFMDEPTSGLDARAAAIVMRTIRNTVDTGRTVVCTIHQPSMDLFEAFDELLLLKAGGQVIYLGPLGLKSQRLIEYFESIPGVPKIRANYNPANWMLDITSKTAETRQRVDFAEQYKSSDMFRVNKESVKELCQPTEGSKDLYFPTKYSQPVYRQFETCLWKQWWIYWRTPNYNLVRFFCTFITALLLGSIFWRIGFKRDEANDLRVVVASMVVAVQFIGIINCSNVQPVISAERKVFYRERGAGLYSAFPYTIAQVLVEIPYVFLQSFYYTAIVYSMMSFEWTATKFLWFYFISLSSFLYFTYYGMMTVSVTPNQQAAIILASTFYSIFTLFSGFYIPKPRISKWWVWYYWICPLAWTVYGLIASQYGDLEDIIRVPGQADQSIKSYVMETYGYDKDFMGNVAAVLVGFSVLFAFIFVFCVWRLNFQHR